MIIKVIASNVQAAFTKTDWKKIGSNINTLMKLFIKIMNSDDMHS